MEWDESQNFPVEVFRKLGELGVLGAVFPEELGGSGYSYVDYSIVMEELARVDPSIALSVAAHVSLCTNHIYLAGNEEQKRRYIPKLASGEWIGSLVADRARSGFRCRRHAYSRGARTAMLGAERQQDVHHQRPGRRRLRGDGGDRSRGIVARHFGVHGGKGHAGIPGRQEGKQAGDALFATGEMIFTDCRVPASQLCGKPGEGFVDALRILDGGRISIAALAVGIAQGAYEAALAIFQAAQTIRPLHFGIPGDSAQAGRHGDGDRRGASADAARGVDEGQRRRT